MYISVMAKPIKSVFFFHSYANISHLSLTDHNEVSLFAVINKPLLYIHLWLVWNSVESRVECCCRLSAHTWLTVSHSLCSTFLWANFQLVAKHTLPFSIACFLAPSSLTVFLSHFICLIVPRVFRIRFLSPYSTSKQAFATTCTFGVWQINAYVPIRGVCVPRQNGCLCCFVCLSCV